jgi:hypothetical protein
MRQGEDYVNNDKRYNKAHELLDAAYTEALQDPTATHLELARICLWNGITLNENLDIESYVKRNEAALKWYKKGLRHIRNCDDDEKCVIVKASLYNSIGVAHHHRTTRWVAGKPIPRASFYNYRKSRDLILAHPEYKKNKKFALLSKKLDENSAGHVHLGGAGGSGGGIGNWGGNVV